ncbi:MAG TPA: GNAT family N-acetyltransferase [Solirubrobacteraceae bacterium]|jgi:ribosomal protein S18 acetylase RimI-like enzyme|nr:GNAT family N-acetyltransferase [Solirubrobacteraceae bacterium]
MSARAWRAGPEEAETVATLLTAFRDHLDRGRPSDNAILAGVERLIEGLDAEFLLACADDDSPPTGVAQLRFRFSLWEASPDAWLEDVFVLPAARRHGIGTALVTAAVARAGERGSRRIELDVTEDNAPALALYEGIGFSAAAKGARSLYLGRRLEGE